MVAGEDSEATGIVGQGIVHTVFGGEICDISPFTHGFGHIRDELIVKSSKPFEVCGIGCTLIEARSLMRARNNRGVSLFAFGP